MCPQFFCFPVFPSLSEYQMAVGLQSNSNLHVFSLMGIKPTTVDLLMGGGKKTKSLGQSRKSEFIHYHMKRCLILYRHHISNQSVQP